MMRFALIVLLIGLLAVTAAHAAPLTLQATDNMLGKTIAKYMQDAHQVEFEIKAGDADDPTIMRTEKGEKVADYPFLIVTVPYAKDDNDKIISRMVVLMVIPSLKVPDAKRGAVLEAMNKLNNDNDFTHLYIDDDGDVAFRWAMVITKGGLPAEAVWDAYANMLPAWEAAGEALNKVLAE